MTFSIVVASVFALGAIIGYASCYAASRADRQSEEYFALKEAERRRKNLKNGKN